MTEVVVWNQHGRDAGRRIAQAVPEVLVVDIPHNPQETPSPAAEVLFAAGRYSAPSAQWATGVRWVHAGSSGVETYPADLLSAEVVTCSRGVRSQAIAEFVLAAILAKVKDMPRIWSPDAVAADFALTTLAGSTLGLIGVGTIGQSIARLAGPFGMRILGVRRSATTGRVGSIEVVTLERLLAESDHVVVAAPATALSTGLLDKRAFGLIKAGAHLVNVSRGAVIDHDELLAALDDGRVAQATLDVTEPEPLPADARLRQHPRVRLSPHLSYMDGQPAKVVDFFIENLRRYLRGTPLLGVVDVTAGY